MLAHGRMIGKHYNRNQVFNDLNQTRQKFNGTSAQEKNVNFFLVRDRLTLRFRVSPSCFQEWRRCGTHIMYCYYDTHLPNLLSVDLPEKIPFFLEYNENHIKTYILYTTWKSSPIHNTQFFSYYIGSSQENVTFWFNLCDLLAKNHIKYIPILIGDYEITIFEKDAL